MRHLVLSTLASIVVEVRHTRGTNTDPRKPLKKQALAFPTIPERTAGYVVIPEMPQTVKPAPLGIMISEIVARPFKRLAVEE